ncbi:MAG: hypothetical protein ACRECZ_05930 [Methylocella sp.]
MNEKAEGGGKQATGKTSRTGGRMKTREVFDRLRYRAQDRVKDRVHVLDLDFGSQNRDPACWR